MFMLDYTHNVVDFAIRHTSGHIQRRALESDKEGYGAGVYINLFGLALTVVGALLCYASVKYTIDGVIMTLAMVEEETTTTSLKAVPRYLDEKSLENGSANKVTFDVELSVTRSVPVTAKIRTANKHLREVGGRWASWRGLSASICINLFLWTMHRNLGTAAELMRYTGPASRLVISLLVAVLYSRLHMAWTHIVISPPSTLRWWRRIPGGNRPAKALALPAMAVVLAEYAVVLLPSFIHGSFGPLPDYDNKDLEMDRDLLVTEICRLISTVSMFLTVFIAVWMPANVVLTRIEASLLPEDIDTIVPFDRSLDGTTPAPEEPIKYMAWYAAAWRTFDRPARRRLLKLYAKLALILFGLCTIFAVLISKQVDNIGLDRLAAFGEKLKGMYGPDVVQVPDMVQQL